MGENDLKGKKSLHPVFRNERENIRKVEFPPTSLGPIPHGNGTVAMQTWRCL